MSTVEMWNWLFTVPLLGLILLGLTAYFGLKALFALLEEMEELIVEPD